MDAVCAASICDMRSIIAAVLLLAVFSLAPLCAETQKVKVFILAGQSNAEGYGLLRTLDQLGEHPTHGGLLAKLKAKDGPLSERDDVTIYWNKESKEQKHGPLSAEWGAMTGESIGPELMFGTVLGDAYEAPVLIIKTAWGGKSVWSDFRSPGAGEMTWNEKRVLKRDRHLRPGESYRMMVSEIKGALEKIAEIVPGYRGQGYELAGLAWFQGWNDYCEWHLQLDGKPVGMGLIDRYQHNLVALFRDLREELGAADMPIAIGELGVGGHEMAERAKDPDDHEAVAMVRFRAAQKAVAEDSSLLGKLTFVPTLDYWDARLQELRVMSDAFWQEKQKKGIADTEENHLPTKALNDEFLRRGGHWVCHYNGSATSYCLVGKALAEALLEKQITPVVETGEAKSKASGK